MDIELPVLTDELELIPGSTTHANGFVPVVRVVCRLTEQDADIAFLNTIFYEEAAAVREARQRAVAIATHPYSVRHAMCLAGL